MAVTVDDAKLELNIPSSNTDDDVELQLYVDAANEWIDAKVTDTSVHPNLVKLATLFLIGHLWESQRGPAATPLAGDEVVMVRGVGYAIPNRVLELLDLDLPKTKPTYSFPDAVTWPDSVEYPVP